MQYAHYLAAAALLASSAAAAPGGVAAGFDVGAKVGPFEVEVAAGAEVDLSLCHGAHAGLAVGAKVKVGCDFHKPDFSARMRTPAHLRYEEALEIYHDIMYLVRHTLMTRGKERAIRLIEIAAMIRDGEEILIVAGVLNTKDDRKIRKRWVQHEINSLEAKFRRARFWAMHLPNLYLAEDIFNFAVDLSVKTVEFAVAVPIVVGAAVGIAIHEAVHLVARAFHFMGRVLRWTLDEIEYAFILLAKKIKSGLKKIGHGIHKIGHEIKEGIIAIGHGLHHAGHEIKEGLEDGVSIIVDIGHHAFQRHHCHQHCSGNVGLVIVGDDSSSSSSSSSSEEDQCSCGGEEAEVEVEETTVSAVCVEKEQVCSREQFTATVQANYNIQLAWSKTESIEKVKTTMVEINQAITQFGVDLKQIEVDASSDNLED
jgi:hypothetical protein